MTFHERVLEFGSVRALVAARCVSDLGRRRIAELCPATDAAILDQAISLVREMMKLISERKEPPIFGLRDAAAHLKKVARERAILDPNELLEVRDFCDTAQRMRRFFETLQSDYPSLTALAMPLYGVPALVRTIDETVAPNGTVRDTASELLQRLRADIFAAEQTIQKVLQRMVRTLAASGDLQDDFFTLRNDRYVLPVKSNNRGKVKGIIHDSSNTGETVFIEPFEVLEQANALADLRLREREEIFRILLRVAGHVRDELNVLLSNQEILSEFDMVFAKARFGSQNRCSFPTLTDMSRPINLVDAHHPLLYANDPASSRALNIALDTQDRVLVVTGPNAGGKTTALKTIGLTALMVQCAIPAPLSSRSRMPVFQNVLADIGDEQNVLEGYSTFSAHMFRMRDIVNVARFDSLVLLDELGTATDPGEGAALAVAILEWLADRGGLTVVSTHLGALKNWAFEYPKGRNASFRLSESDHRPTFRLSLDVPGISEALVIAEQAGLPAEIIARARGLRPQGEHDVTALLLSLQEKEQRLATQLEEAEQLRTELDLQKLDVEELENRLREEKRKYKAELLADKEAAIAELRGRLEHLIARQPSKRELQEARSEFNEAVAETSLERERARHEPGLVDPARLSKGDRVYVRSLNEEGRVEEVLAKRGEVRVALRRMTVTAKASDLAPPDRAEVQDSEVRVHFRRPSDFSNSIDLHGSRVEEALARLDKFLDEALAAGVGFVRIVHGHGSGALRRAVHEHLRDYPQVGSFRHGAPNEGGGSVTIAEFK